jgi:hypothetical protein
VCILGRDWISKEGTDVAPNDARKANVERAMYRVGKLGVQSLISILRG